MTKEEILKRIEKILSDAYNVKIHGKNNHVDTSKCFEEFKSIINLLKERGDIVYDEGLKDAFLYGGSYLSNGKYRDVIQIITSQLGVIKSHYK